MLGELDWQCVGRRDLAGNGVVRVWGVRVEPLVVERNGNGRNFRSLFQPLSLGLSLFIYIHPEIFKYILSIYRSGHMKN